MKFIEEDSGLSSLQKRIHRAAVEKGWWEGERNVGEMLALVHSEVSEALEEWRVGKMSTYFTETNPQKPEGFYVELADAVIRILDIAEHFGVNLQEVIELKMAYNETRPYRHGGKKA